MSTKKTIIIFVHCFPPARGGLEYLVGEIKKILDTKYEVHIITGQGLTLDSYKTFSDFTTDNSNHVHRLELNYFWQRLANKFLNKIIFKIGFFSPFYFGPILKYSPDIINIIKKSDLIIGAGMPTKMFYDSYFFAKKFNKPLILHPSYHNVSYYNRCYFFQQALSYATRIIFQTELERNKLCHHYQIDDNKLTKLAFNAYSVKQIARQLDLLPTISKTLTQHLNKKNITLGFVGQITRRKKITVLKEYLDQYFTYWQNQKFQIHLLLAGAKTNTSLEIESLFAPYIKKKIVKILFNFENKADIYRQIDVFINPSVEESLGLVNFEAIFHGIPTLVTANSAFAEFIPKDVFDSSDLKLLHCQITRIIKKPPNQFQILQKFNKSIYSKKLLRLTSALT